jgi:hypothetical protein
MADEELPIPVEIPWRLAATTQELKSGDADEATISLFSFEPDLPTFTSDYPDERIYYFKFVVSVSPIAEPNGGFSDVALSYLENGLPIMLLLLDLKVTPLPSTLGGIRPYFHAAAPLHRTMVESGVVGHEFYEGAAAGVSVGKSGSQMHETVSSKTVTTTDQSAAARPCSSLRRYRFPRRSAPRR